MNKNKLVYQIVLLIGFVFIFGLSLGVLAPKFSDPSAYTSTISYLDQQKTTVTDLAAASAGASAALTLLPGDTCSSIANSLSDLSTKFLVVLTALYFEKYMLTLIGLFVFKILIPAACVFGVLWIFIEKRVLLNWAVKLTLFAVCSMLVIPSGIFTSRLIEKTYKSSIDSTINSAIQIQDEIAHNDEVQSIEDIEITVEAVDGWQWLGNAIKNWTSNVSDKLEGVPSAVSSILNRFIEALAILIITSCLIPILVVLVFAELIKMLVGVNMNSTDENITKILKLLQKNEVKQIA